MSSLISSISWSVSIPSMAYLSDIYIFRVKRGVSARHPTKYILDDAELERVSALAHIELEDARKEMERAHKAANSMGTGVEGEEADDSDEDGWVE
jgi:periodic tryptophan protein 1